MLRWHGYEVRIQDLFAEGYDKPRPIEGSADFLKYGSEDGVKAQMDAFRPDVVGVSSIFSNQADNVQAVLDNVRKVNPDTIRIIGGAHARYFPRHYISAGLADAVFTSEAEACIVDFLEYLNGHTTDAALEGIVLRNRRDGSISVRPEARLINSRTKNNSGWAELDEIPFPQWDLYNMERYFSLRAYQSPYTIGTRVGQIYATRGCSARCTFCTTTNFWGGRLRRRSPENVFVELELLKDRYQIDEFHVQDDNITNDMEHARALFQTFKQVNLPWATPAGTALWRMDEELLELMAASGAYQVTFAVESGSQRVLRDLIRKPLDLDRTKRLIHYAGQLGLHVHGFFIIGMPPMFGHPGESIEEMHCSLRFAEDCGFDSASFFAATPIVGSVLLEECLRQGLISPELELFRMSYKQGVISVPGLWPGAKVAELAASFNAKMNSKPRKYAAARSWVSDRY